MLLTVLIAVINVAIADDFVTDGLFNFWTLDKNTITGDTVKDVFGKTDGKMMGAGNHRYCCNRPNYIGNWSRLLK